MRVMSSSLSTANTLNACKYFCNITMDYDVYLQLVGYGFNPKEFIQNNKVKILIELKEMVDVDKITSNIEVNTPVNRLNFIKPIRNQSELDNERLTEIVDAIVRYRKSEMAIPTDWIQEYNTIVERLKNNPK